VAKQDWLRAQAFIDIFDSGGAAGAGAPEIVVVVDTTSADARGRPVVDWGMLVEIPWQVLMRWLGFADVNTVLVRNGVVLHAAGRLDLGRSTRLANRSQRRALRATYPTCAIPGCDVRFSYCQIHHVHWWDHGGLTDLDNLIPVCSRHHHAVHDDGWHLSLSRSRILTVSLPDGTVMSTGPPRRQAA
jgi:HNH endonuclease